MTQISIPLAKRTKQEILEEYEKLQEQMEELRTISQVVHSPAAAEIVEKTKSKTPQTLEKIFSDLQTSLHSQLAELRSSLLEKSELLQELQQAIDISRQQLALHRNITIAADSLDQLVDDHTKRTETFETALDQRKREFEEQMTAKKKAWEREMEEYEYNKKLKREREQVETEEREKAIATRELALRSQEQEILQMRKTIEQFPTDRDAAILERESQIREHLTQQFAHEKTLLEKESSSQIRLLDLTVKNLEERLSAQTQEAHALKALAEEANAKAQTLAMKAIERPTTIVTPTQTTQSGS